MPKIPVLESQLGAPRGAALDVSSPQTYMPFTAATYQTGGMIEQRGETMLREYDTSRAYTAFNQLRDVSRGKLAELLSREGLSAQGAQTEYTEWYRKAQEDVAKETINAFSQRSLFDKLSQSHQQGDLDRLAGHEFTEHKKYKVSVVNGYVATTARDVADNAADYEKVDGMIYGKTEPDGSVTPGLWGAIDALGDGIDRTSAKMKATEEARYSQVDSLISSDPKKAMDALEKYKSELGDKYSPLKKRLESQTHDNMLGDAFGALNAQFGNNHEAKIAYVNNKANWAKLGAGFDYKEAKELDARFSGMLADRDRVETNMRQRLEQEQKLWGNRVLQMRFNPDAPKYDIHDLHRRRLLSDEDYEAAVKPKTSTEVDNPFVFSDMHDKINRGIDVTSEVRDAVERGDLSNKTAGSILKDQVDERKKRESANIARVMKPSDLDFSQDKRIVYGEAMRLFDSKLQSGMSYEEAGAEVRGVFLDDLRRSTKNIPTPEGISYDQKTDLKALEQARAVLVAKRNQISPSEYLERMTHIDNLVKIASEQQEADISNELIEIQRKARGMKGGQK